MRLEKTLAVLVWSALVACADPDARSGAESGEGDESGKADTTESGSEPGGSDIAFRDINGVMWFYTTANDTRYADLEADLGTWKERGIRTIGIYSPYHGEKDQWLGAAPVDFYDVPPQNGTLDDLRRLIDSAHAKGMKVVSFMGFHSIDERSEMFRTAEEQYKAGDRTSHEVASFRWTDDPNAPTPVPVPFGPSEWKRSETAGAYYWALWDNAGLDVGLPEAVTEIETAIEFWIDVGLDGLMLDSGVVDRAFEPLWVELPLRKKREMWITFESTWVWDDRKFDDFGLTSWFAFEDNDYANTYSLVLFPEEGEVAIDVDELEEELSRVDWARERGKLTHAWSVLERRYPDDRMRVQEAALLAGAGIMYGAPANEDAYATWPAAIRADWERVLVTVNDNAALLPSASRTRVDAGPDEGVYAMKRTASDGSQTALLVYNFTTVSKDVTLDLTGTGIGEGVTPTELYTDRELAAVQGSTYTVSLRSYGFAFLDVTDEG
jgi:hypothetical protein